MATCYGALIKIEGVNLKLEEEWRLQPAITRQSANFQCSQENMQEVFLGGQLENLPRDRSEMVH